MDTKASQFSSLLKPHLRWIVPILVFLMIAPWTPSIDRAIAKIFYSGNGNFTQTSLLKFLFKYGEFPAWGFGMIALAILIISYWKIGLKKWKQPASVYLITLVLGAGIVVHLLLKQFWGRPRPRQLIEFGGFANFQPFWMPLTEVTPEPGRSFPCGHCTMGFVFFAFCLIGKRLDSQGIFWTGIALVFTLGVGMSLMRIMQGGHFFSDTLAAALIMWLSALFADAFVYRSKKVKS